MKKGPFYEVKVKIQNLKACISRAPAIFGTKTYWQSFHTILSNSWKNGWFCIIFRCFFALPKMVILLHKMEIVRILFLLSVAAPTKKWHQDAHVAVSAHAPALVPNGDTLEAVKAAYADVLSDEHLDNPMNAPPVTLTFKKGIKIKPFKVKHPIRTPLHLQASAAEYMAELKKNKNLKRSSRNRSPQSY